MTTYKLCAEDAMDWSSTTEEDMNHIDSTSRLTVPEDDTAVGNNGRRWSADNGRAASAPKSPRIERIRRVSLGLYNQTAGALEAGVSSVKKGISRAGQNVSDRAQVKVPRVIRSKIGVRKEENKNIMSSMDSEDGDHQVKGRLIMDSESSDFG